MLPFLTHRDTPADSPLLHALTGQAIVHTRVAQRGTWTVTARGWVLYARGQMLGAHAVGLRDPLLLGRTVHRTALGNDGELAIQLAGGQGPMMLSMQAPWQLTGPRGALLEVDNKGNVTREVLPGAPIHATPEAIAAHRASHPSGIEQRLLRAAALEPAIHPGHVVHVLAQAGALDDGEFERRGPILLARLLARGELQAGFMTDGVFRPWSLPLEEIVEHVGTTWQAIGGREPSAGMIGWFAITPRGRDVLGPTGEDALGPGMSGYDSPGVVGRRR